jgi:hypothetical protein
MTIAVEALFVGLLHNMQNYGVLRRCSIRPVFDPELRPKGAHGRGQDREPVERPFHDLWTDGGESEKRSPCPTCHRTCSELWKLFLRHDTRGFSQIFSSTENSNDSATEAQRQKEGKRIYQDAGKTMEINLQSNQKIFSDL